MYDVSHCKSTQDRRVSRKRRSSRMDQFSGSYPSRGHPPAEAAEAKADKVNRETHIWRAPSARERHSITPVFSTLRTSDRGRQVRLSQRTLVGADRASAIGRHGRVARCRRRPPQRARTVTFVEASRSGAGPERSTARQGRPWRPPSPPANVWRLSPRIPVNGVQYSTNCRPGVAARKTQGRRFWGRLILDRC
jgi:hypothetical protein